jgi:hypothetical protein
MVNLSIHRSAALKYMCLIFMNESKLNGWSRFEGASCESAQRAYEEVLKKRGYLLFAEILASTATAVTIRNDGGQTYTAAGPHEQIAEALGAVYEIDARDLNEAIRLASAMPWARIGSVEIRPVKAIADELSSE